MFMWCLFTMLFVSFRVASLVSFGFVPELWGFVRLRPFVFFLDSFFFLAGFQARWSYPRNHYYLCYASLLALLLCQCYDAYHLLVSLPNCHVKPLTHHVLANRWLAMLPLCSAPLIALLVAGEDWSLFLVGTWRCCSLLEHVYLLGYHNISYLINASIYLVKGGRLGLMPGVLFHSCRPSFRHTGIMFLEFAFLTRLGDLWDPLDSSPWIKLLQQGPTLVLPFAT